MLDSNDYEEVCRLLLSGKQKEAIETIKNRRIPRQPFLAYINAAKKGEELKNLRIKVKELGEDVFTPLRK